MKLLTLKLMVIGLCGKMHLILVICFLFLIELGINSCHSNASCLNDNDQNSLMTLVYGLFRFTDRNRAKYIKSYDKFDIMYVAAT